jgi:hypothetical protein
MCITIVRLLRTAVVLSYMTCYTAASCVDSMPTHLGTRARRIHHKQLCSSYIYSFAYAFSQSTPGVPLTSDTVLVTVLHMLSVLVKAGSVKWYRRCMLFTLPVYSITKASEATLKCGVACNGCAA